MPIPKVQHETLVLSIQPDRVSKAEITGLVSPKRSIQKAWYRKPFQVDDGEAPPC